MNKPVFLYASDIEDYKKERGLKPVYFNLPFPLCRNNQELLNAINQFDMNSYLNRLKGFRKQYRGFDNGSSSKHVVDLIFEKTK